MFSFFYSDTNDNYYYVTRQPTAMLSYAPSQNPPSYPDYGVCKHPSLISEFIASPP